MALSVKSNPAFFSRLFGSNSKVLSLRNCKRFAHTTAPLCFPALDKSTGIIKPKEYIDPIKDVTIPEFLFSNLHKWENAPAFECGITGRRYTHGEIYKLSRNFATALMQHGLKRNDVVGIVLQNVPEFPIAIFGCWEAGLIPTTVNPGYRAEEVAKQMNDSGAKAIITLSEFVPLVNEVQKLAPAVKSTIVIGEPVQGCHSFSQMVKVNSQGVEFLKGAQFDTEHETAALLYSSGTTGPPKGVMLTHSNICSNVFQTTRPGYISTGFFDEKGSQEHFMGILPFFHIFGFTVILAKSLYQGGFTRTLPKFEPATFIRAIREHKPTCIHLVPPLISFMVNSPEITKNEFESVHAIMGGAAPIGEALIHKLLDKAGKYFFFQEGYGMTELSPVSHILPASTRNTKIGSTGVALPGTECKIVNPETGASVGLMQRGELCIRGPQVMKGYFNNEKATKETIDSDGWLHTGDIAICDEMLLFYIVDRMKELIKVKGLQVAPSELEDILRTHPNVADVAVIGIPDERAGELPRAYIVRKKDSVTEKELQDFIKDKVSDHKHLKGGVEFLEAIPKAASGKILRRELKASYLSKH